MPRGVATGKSAALRGSAQLGRETLAYLGGSRCRIETEFEAGKSDVGMDEYEARIWAGWRHHVT